MLGDRDMPKRVRMYISFPSFRPSNVAAKEQQCHGLDKKKNSHRLQSSIVAGFQLQSSTWKSYISRYRPRSWFFFLSSSLCLLRIHPSSVHLDHFNQSIYDLLHTAYRFFNTRSEQGVGISPSLPISSHHTRKPRLLTYAQETPNPERRGTFASLLRNMPKRQLLFAMSLVGLISSTRPQAYPTMTSQPFTSYRECENAMVRVKLILSLWFCPSLSYHQQSSSTLL